MGRGGEGREGSRGQREGEGRPPNVRDSLTPLIAKSTDMMRIDWPQPTAIHVTCPAYQ